MTCDRLGLIGRQMFAIDGVKLPANASKERSGTHAELRHRAGAWTRPPTRSSSCIAAGTTTREKRTWTRSARRASKSCARKRRPRATSWRAAPRGATARESSSSPTSQTTTAPRWPPARASSRATRRRRRWTASHQVIVAADVTGSGSEQSMLLPMIEQTEPLRAAHTLITADAGYHSDEQYGRSCASAPSRRWWPTARCASATNALPARSATRPRPDPLHDKSAGGQAAARVRLYRPGDFIFDAHTNSCVCPAWPALVQQRQPLQLQRAHRAQVHRHAGRLRCLRAATTVPAPSRAHAGAPGGDVRQGPAGRTRATQLMKQRHRLGARPTHLQPAHCHRGAGVCQHPPQQAAEPLHAARAREGEHAVAAVLPGAQHREAGAQRLSVKRASRSAPVPAPKGLPSASGMSECRKNQINKIRGGAGNEFPNRLERTLRVHRERGYCTASLGPDRIYSHP